jgi:hypothetical protein
MVREVSFGLRDFASLTHPYLLHDFEHEVVAFSATETALASQVLDTQSGTRRLTRRPGGGS